MFPTSDQPPPTPSLADEAARLRVVIEIPIADVEVDERLREDYGDLAGLARSIKKYGQLHPIIISRRLLVAGGRRLFAMREAGYTSINAIDLNDLDEATRHEIELAENDDRLNLTPYEKSKQLLRKVKQIAEAVSGNLPDTSPELGGQPRHYAAPKADLAEALGIDDRTIRRAEHHVSAVEHYPGLGLETEPQSVAIATARQLDALPEPTRLTIVEAIKPAEDKNYAARIIFNAMNGIVPANPTPEEKKLIRQGQSILPPELIAQRELMLTRLATDKQISAISDLVDFEVEAAAEKLTESHFIRIRCARRDFNAWCDKLDAAREANRRFRLVSVAEGVTQ